MSRRMEMPSGPPVGTVGEKPTPKPPRRGDRSKKAAKPKKKKPPRDYRPIPTMGTPKVIFWTVTGCTMGFIELGAKLSKTNPWRPRVCQREADLIAYEMAYAARTESLIERLRFLLNMGLQPVISFCNDKSAGKSTAAIYIASLIAEYCRKVVVILPASSNTATGTLRKMSGITGNVIDIVELGRDIKKYGAYRALSERLPRTKHGVGVVIETKHAVVNDTEEYTLAQFTELIKTMYPNVDAIILDHGNDNINRTSIALAATRMSTSLVFTTNLRTPISGETMQRTMAGYHTDTLLRSSEEIGNEPLPGESISTPIKVANSVVIAAAYRDGDFVDFDELTRSEEQGANAPAVPKWHGHGVIVSYDDYIGKEEPQPADLGAIDRGTHQEYLEAAVAALEATAINLGIPIPEDAPQLVKLPELTTEGSR